MKTKTKKQFGWLCVFAAAVLSSLFCTRAVSADPLVPGYLYASSTLDEPGYDHSVWRLQDYDLSTDWSEGVEGPGYGESIYLETDRNMVITGGMICPGYYKSEDLFYQNGAPSRIYIHTGSQEAYLDVTEYAESYEPDFEGFHFLFDEPLVSDGLVTMTIVGVRSGWKYADTCISEFRLEGHQAAEGEVPYDDGSHPHVSEIIPDYDFVYNPEGLGSDGRGPDEYFSGDAAYLDEETKSRLTAFGSALYKLHCGHANPESKVISSEDLYSYSRAYMLNWYQSQIEDDRIWSSGNYHYAYAEDLKNIVDELFKNASPEEDVQALCDYLSGGREGELIRMNGSGSAWDAGTFHLEYPVDAGEIQGRTLLMGNVMTYDPASGGYVRYSPYYLYFEQDPYAPAVFRFDMLYAYDPY